jgi:hypothetical protein
MIARFLFVILATAALAHSARAQPFEPLQPLDLGKVDPAMIGDLYGPWDLHDKTGRKTCRVNLKKAQVIGGSEIEIAPDCAKKFPIMSEITAWRVLEGWTIDFADAMRKTRIRFSTPDDRYVAFPDGLGIAGLVKP